MNLFNNVLFCYLLFIYLLEFVDCLMVWYLQASLTKTNSATTTTATSSSVDKQMAENLAQDMSDLMHDFDVVSRINSMVSIHPSIQTLIHPPIYPGGQPAMHLPRPHQWLHGLHHGPDPEEHQAEGRRDVLAGQELPAAGGQEEGQDRNFDLPGWCIDGGW